MATTATPAQRKTGGIFLIEETNPHEVFTPEDFNDQHKLIEQTADDFATQGDPPRLRPHRAQGFRLQPRADDARPPTWIDKCRYPEEYGGMEMDKVIVVRSSPTAWPSRPASAVAFSAHVGIGTLPFVWFGTEEQKKKYLPKLATARVDRRLCAVGEQSRAPTP